MSEIGVGLALSSTGSGNVLSTVPDLETVSVDAKVRIQTLDLIRGISILGILAVNADGFAAPTGAALNPSTWLYTNVGATATSFWIIDVFFHDKFITLFSMLFGVSVFLVGGERSEKRKERILWRRLAVLFLLAMIHGFGIWWGDILSLYAVAGFVMTFCRSWRPKTLMIVGVALVVMIGCRSFQASGLPFASPTTNAAAKARIVANEAAMKRKATIAADLVEAKGSWSGAYAINTREYLHVMSRYPLILPSTLGLMMIGLSLFKVGFLAGRSNTRCYTATIACGGIALGAVAWICWQKDVVGVQLWGANGILLLLAPVISLAYAATIILSLRAGATSLLSPVAAVGRMALTNYLSQSLIMTSIFYGGRGAMMGQINRSGLWVIVGVIWLLQLTCSPLWLRRFEMGPFEWSWRCLTYGHWVPLLKRRH